MTKTTADPPTQTAAERVRAFIKDLDAMVNIFDEKIATKEAILSRLTYILGDDEALAQTVYDYVILGHLSYYNQLRTRLGIKR